MGNSGRAVRPAAVVGGALQGEPEVPVEFSASLVLDGSVRNGGTVEGLEPSLGVPGEVGIRWFVEALSDVDEGSGVIEGVGDALAGQAFGDAGSVTAVGRRRGGIAIGAPLDVRGETAPGVTRRSRGR